MSLSEKIAKRAERGGPGWVFTRSDLVDLGSTHAIGMALQRLLKNGEVRRVARGLYEVPRTHAELGTLSPDIEKVARALAGRHRIRLQPTGAYAANALGLSEQVPAKVVFLTDGPSRRVKIGRQEIQLLHTSPRNMATAGRLSGMLIQAFRSLGQQHITPARMKQLKRTLPEKERRKLLKDLPLTPTWMHPLFRELAGNSL